MSLFSGIRVLEELDSPINGEIQVVCDILGKVSIRAGGVTQSGGIMEDVLHRAFSKLRNLNLKAQSCLILGVGGGSAIRLASQLWPGVKILGIEIDPMMIELGRRYMDLDKIPNLEITVVDAVTYVTAKKLGRSRFDLILVDLYQKDEVPEKAESLDFIKAVRGLVSERGVVVFNRLFYGAKRKSVVRLREKLGRLFSSIITMKPVANILFICYP